MRFNGNTPGNKNILVSVNKTGYDYGLEISFLVPEYVIMYYGVYDNSSVQTRWSRWRYSLVFELEVDKEKINEAIFVPTVIETELNKTGNRLAGNQSADASFWNKVIFLGINFDSLRMDVVSELPKTTFMNFLSELVARSVGYCFWKDFERLNSNLMFFVGMFLGVSVLSFIRIFEWAISLWTSLYCRKIFENEMGSKSFKY